MAINEKDYYASHGFNYDREKMLFDYTAKITEQLITSPTDTKAGAVSYTAIFTNDVFGTQTKNVSIPALCEQSVLRLPASIIQIDEEAFLIVSRVSEVRGRGFTMNKQYKLQSK